MSDVCATFLCLDPALIDAIGISAFVFFLGAYAMVSLGRWQPESLRFQGMNLMGVIAILISLSKDFNLPIFVLEICWGAISLYGIWKALRMRFKAK